MSNTITIVGCDPHPEGGHFVLTEWDVSAKGHPELLFACQDMPWRTEDTMYAVEDPRGVLFSTTNSKLWSETCFQAGRICEAYNAEIVSPADARESLAKAARADQAPRKDREVRELIEVIYGKGCFAREKQCPKRKNKSHGKDCPVCEGTGAERKEGRLVELNTPHYRDAFVVAQHVAMRLAGGE